MPNYFGHLLSLPQLFKDMLQLLEYSSIRDILVLSKVSVYIQEMKRRGTTGL